MIEVNLFAPIMLTRAALPHLRESGEGLVINIASVIALLGLPFYATYAAVKAGLAHFGEALLRELIGEGVHVLSVYPGGADTPMMQSNRAGSELGFGREPASAVAEEIVTGVRDGAVLVVPGGAARGAMIEMNRDNPLALDQNFQAIKPALAEAVHDHSAL